MKGIATMSVGAFLMVAITSVLISGASSAKILVFIGMSSHSHRVGLQPLGDKLASIGHEVTFFSPIKPERSNSKIKEFCTKRLQDLNDNFQDESSTLAALNRVEDRNYDPFFEGTYIFDMMIQMQQTIIMDPEFQKWINETRFDLIIIDHPGKEFVYPIAHMMKAKVIEYVPVTSPIFFNYDAWGLPIEPWHEGFIPNKYPSLLSQYEFNAFTGMSWYWSYRDYYLPKLTALYKEVLTFDYPPLEELLLKFDLVFINDHFSSAEGRSYPSFMIPVGGMHTKDSNGTLPKDIENFLADADEFVYFSFGSIIQVSKLPLAWRKMLFDTVGSLKKTKFLWKWEGEIPADMPKNAMGKNWFPQQDVLAHPKCKGFITQGGLMSIQQSIHHGVPILVIPGFGDQPMNARVAERKGYGIYLELADLNKETFSKAIHELLRNKKYSENMKTTSKLFKDRPMSAVDTAAWWTEYVLRHDTFHLKSEAFNTPWWRRRMIDFYLKIFIVAALALAFISYLLLRIVKFVTGASGAKATKVKSS